MRFLAAFLSALLCAGAAHAAWPSPGGNPGSTTSSAKIAEDFSGATFSEQLEAAAASTPVGGVVIITESHTFTTTANIDDANTTIQCAPNVTLTAGANTLRMISLEAANITVRDCHFEGAKGSFTAHAVTIQPSGDGAKILRNRMLSFRGRGVYLDPDATLTALEDVLIEDNVIDNSIDPTTGAQTFDLIYGPLGVIVPRIKILNNTLISRDCGGDPIFLFMGTGSDDGLISGNYMDAEGCADTGALRVTACTELAIAGGSTPGNGTTVDDFLLGWRVTDNTCITRDFTFQSMAPPGMSKGSVFSGNNIYDLGTDTTSTQTRYASEVGNMIEATLTGNVWNGNGRGRSIYLHDAEYITITGNTFNFKRAPVVGADEAIRIEDGCHGTDSLLTASHIIISDNIFHPPAGTNNVNLSVIVARCDGTTTCGSGAFTGTTGTQIEDISIQGNNFWGTGSPGGTGTSQVADLDEVGTEGVCDIDDVRVVDNRIDNFDHVILFDNHVFTDTEIARNKTTNLLTSYIATTGTVTGVVFESAAEAATPITAAQCGDGSRYVASAVNACGGAAGVVGDLCTCAGAAWTAH